MLRVPPAQRRRIARVRYACKQYTALIKYDAPSFGAAASYDPMRGNAGAFAPLTSSGDMDSRSIVDGYIKFATLKAGFGWLHRSLSAGVTSTLYNPYFFGLAYTPVSPLVLVAQVDKYIQAHVTSSTELVARASYYLSKNTSIYSSVGYMINGQTTAHLLPPAVRWSRGRSSLV